MNYEDTRAQIDQLIEDLSSDKRRARQDSAHTLALLAKANPAIVKEYIPELIDGLHRPEAQTRWEVLDALRALLLDYASQMDEAFDAVDEALFDEKSSTVRLSAFCYFCTYGSLSQKNSEEVWPVLEDALHCFHGDVQYRDMLCALLEFVQGDISEQVKASVKEDARHDVEFGTGYIKAFAQDILECVSS